MDKLFLVEKGKFVVIRDGDKEVAFSSFEEFYKYYNLIDLTNKWYIDYEPERSVYYDSVLNIKTFEQIQQYDDVIAAIDTIIANKTNVYYGKDLEETKIIRKQYIKNIFDIKLNLGCLTSLGFRFDCNDNDRSNMIAAVMLLQLSQADNITFIDYNNTPRILTLEEMIQVGLEIGAYFQSLLYTKNDYYTQIDSKTSIEDVMGVDWV